MNIIRRLLIVLPLTSLSCSGFAQNPQQPEAQPWYQVEVFIFANLNQQASEQERWPEQPVLSYPQRLVELTQLPEPSLDDDPALMENTTETLDTAINDEVIDLNTRGLAPATTANDDLLVTESETKIISEESDTQTPESPIGPVAYQLLPKEQRLLNTEVRRMVASGQYRQLFHQSWLQPLNDRKQAVNLLIRGGEQYGEHFELEGSINLSVERYLHIRTDLWLSRFSTSLGVDQLAWPILPTPPTVIQAAQQRQALMAEQFDLKPLTTIDEPWLPQEQPFQLLFHQQYTVEQTTVMRQHRRMRSNELHYLDHPLMGLLVKITPYEPQQEQEELPAGQAEAEPVTIEAEPAAVTTP